MSGHATRRRLTALLLAAFVVGAGVAGVAGVVDVAGGQAESGTLYVDDPGDDFCGPSDPNVTRYEDIQRAVNAANASDTVVVCDGRYQEAVIVDKPLTIRANRTDGPVVLDADFARGTAITVRRAGSGTVIEGLRIERYPISAVSVEGASEVSVSNLTVIDVSGEGIVATDASDVSVTNVAFDGLSGFAVVASDGSSVSIADTSVTGGSEGVSATGSDVTVRNTVFDGSSGPAVDASGGGEMTVDGIDVRNGAAGVVADSVANLTVVASRFDGTPGPAVEVTGANEALVRGANVTDAPVGVVVESTTDARVVGVRADGLDGPAVNLTDADGATVEGLNVSNGPAGVVVGGSSNVAVTDTTVENIDGTGIELTNADGALVRNVTVTDATSGIGITATGGGEVSNVTVRDATVSGTEDGVLARADDRATLSGLVLSGLNLSGNDRGAGVLATDDSTVTNVTVEGSVLNDSRERGIEISASDGTPSIRDVMLRNLILDGSGGAEGVNLIVRAGILRDIVLENSSVTSHDVGVVVSNEDARLYGVNLFRNRITGDTTGVRIEESGPRPDTRNVGVRQNLVADSGNEGVLVGSGTDARGVRVTRNVIRDNGVGIENDGRTALTAWLNYWGSDSGPSGGVADPRTGVQADGSGDEVAGSVRFDPWIGQGACSADGLENVVLGTVEVGDVELDRSEFQSLCAWNRAPLSLRPDPGDAAMDVANLNLSYNLEGVDGPVSADRRNVSVYEEDTPFDLQFGAGSADSSRFAGEDVQLIVVYDRTRTNASFDVGFDDRAGETVLRSESGDSVTVRGDWGRIGSDGGLEEPFTPGRPGSYTFVLVRSDFGTGVSEVSGQPEARLDGGATVLGFETVVVRETEAEATPTNANASYPAGSDVTLDVSSNLQDASTDHAVFLYDESRFRNATATVTVEATAADVIAGRFDPASDVAVESSIGSANGVVRAAVAFSALGTDVAAGEDSGEDVDPSPFLGLGTRLYDTSATDPTDAPGATPLNGSVVVVESGGSDTTVDVGTRQNFANGTYRYVYVAERGRFLNTSSATGTVEITAPVATPTPTPGDGGGGGGGGGGQPGGGADGEVTVESLELLNESVSAGRSAVVRVDLANFDPARGTITLTLATDGSTLAERSVAVGASSERTVLVRATLNTPGTYPLSLNGESVGSLTVTAAPTETPTDTIAPTTDSPDEGPGPTASPDTGTSPSTDAPSPGAESGSDGTAAPGDDDGASGVGPPPASGTDAVIALGMSLLLLYGVGVAVYVLREHPPPGL